MSHQYQHSTLPSSGRALPSPEWWSTTSPWRTHRSVLLTNTQYAHHILTPVAAHHCMHSFMAPSSSVI